MTWTYEAWWKARLFSLAIIYACLSTNKKNGKNWTQQNVIYHRCFNSNCFIGWLVNAKKIHVFAEHFVRNMVEEHGKRIFVWKIKIGLLVRHDSIQLKIKSIVATQDSGISSADFLFICNWAIKPVVECTRNNNILLNVSFF